MVIIVNYKQDYHWIGKDNTLISEDKNKIYIHTNNGYIGLNKSQYQLLEHFDNNKVNLETILNKYPKKDKNKIEKFINYLIQKGILVEGNKNRKRNLPYFLKRLFFIPIPNTTINKHIGYISNYINIKKTFYTGLFTNIIGMFLLMQQLYHYQLTLNDVPSNITTFFIGFIPAFFHEFWLSIYIQKKGKKVGKLYIRIIYGFIITFATNWSEMLLESKYNRIKMFLFVSNMTLLVSSIESILSYFFSFYNMDYIAKYCTVFSFGTLIFFTFSLWPFFFKGDGYHIFQEITNVYKLRTRFLSLVLFRKKHKDYLTKYEKSVVLLWGIIFIFTLIILQILLYLGIRLII